MSPASQSFRFRESRRLLREAPVRLSVSGEDGELVARTRDIAIGGMFVATSDVRPVGTGTAFVLELGSADAPDTVQGEAAVVWVREAPVGADQPAGMGMRFTRVEPPGEERLAMLFFEPPDEAAGSDAPAAAPPPAPAEAEVTEPGEIEPDVTESEEVETVDDPPDEGSEEPEEPEVTAVEDDVEPADPADPVEAAEESSDEAASLGDGTTDGGEVGDNRAELFGGLAGDDWMSPESDRPAWFWPTVAGVILVGLLLVFLGRPLMRLVGFGGDGAEEQPAAGAQSFEVAAPVEEPARPADPPAAARPSTEPAPDPVAAEVPDPSAPVLSAEATASSSEPAPSPEQAAASAEPAASPLDPAAPRPEPPAPSPEPVVRPRPPALATSSPAPSATPANATALRAISASVQDGRTLVEITGNASFERHHVMPLDAPPRLLVRLIGVQRDYDASAVSAPRLRGVRTGVHGQGATRNLHVVLDLAAPDIVATVERRGDRVVVSLSD